MKSKHQTTAKTSKVSTRKRDSDRIFYLASLIDNISDALISTDMGFNILEWNTAAESMYGWKAAEVIGHPLQEFIQSEYMDETRRDDAIKAVQEEGIWKGEVTQKRKDGKRFPVMASVSLVKDKTGQPMGFVAINRDITERRQAEEKIESLAKFPDENINPVLRFGGDGRLLFANHASSSLLMVWGCEIGGRAPEDIQRTISESLTTARSQEMEVTYNDVIDSLIFVPVIDKNYVNVYGRNITEHKQAERQTKQMQRLYATLSQVNQTIVRVKDREELYQAICDIAVQFGEFQLSWIGLLDETSGDVRPVAANGLDLNDWPLPMINIHAGPLAGGLVARAIHNSNVITSENGQIDEQIQVLQDHFQEPGLHSAAVVPFCLRDRVIGTLTLLSEETGLFNDLQEIHLLEEMGLDVSFALDLMENEKERKQAEEELKRTSQWLLASQRISSTGGWAINLKTGAVWASPEARRIYGTDNRQLTLSLIQTFPLPQYRPILDDALHELITQGTPYDVEFQIAHGLNGTISDLRSLAEYDATEHLILGVVQDITDRKQAEEALRENEERLRLSLQAADQGLYDLNVQTGDAIVNREYAQMLGYDPDTFVETNAAWVERLHPDDRESVAKAYSDYISGLLPEYRIEFRQRMKDGNWKWILSLGKVIEYDAEDRPLRMLGTHTDITERKQAEKALRESEERFRLLFENNPAIMMLIDPVSGVIKDANRTAAKFYGYPLSELRTMNINKINQLTPDEVYGERMRALKEERNFFIFRHRLSNGEIRSVEVHSSPMQLNGNTLLFSIVFDINARKKVEEELRNTQNRMSGIVESAMDAIISMETNQQIVLANSAAEQMFGYGRGELIGKPLELLLPEQFRNAHVHQVRQFGATGITTRSMNAFRAVRGLRASGEEFPAEASISQITVGTDKMYTVILRDITERQQAEEEIQSRSRQLAALLDASQSLTESLNRAEVLQKITDEATNVLNVETSAIYLVEGEHLYLCASTPPLPPEVPETVRRALLADHPHIAEALMTRQPVILPDATEVALLTTAERSVIDVLGLRTIVYVPLVARQNPNGILILGTVGKPREFSRNERDVARALSNQAALAIANAMLYEDLSLYVKELESQIVERKRAEEQIQRQLKYLNALRMIDIAISSSFDLNVILDVVLQQVLSQLGVDASALLLFSTQTQTIEYAASRGFRSDVLHHTQLKLGEGYAGRAVIERKTIHISDLMETDGRLASSLFLEHESFVDYYGTPLIVKGEVKGVLEIYHRSHLKVEDEWQKFLETLAGQAAIAIDNAQLFENLQRSNIHLEQRVIERTAELNRTNAELERANQIKDEFLANMSHELRTPLTSILGLSESLLEERRGSLNDHQQKSIQIIESSGRHLLELINDILDLSKIEAGKFDFYPQPVGVDEICRSSLSFVRSQALKKSITVTYIQDISIARIFADPRRLKQTLVNLLSNAVKFTPENGEVILQVNADPEQDLIRFSVIDNGIGIAVHDLRRLFQPFVQVDSGLNRQHEGTGLGLALVQKLTDLHGGSVQVESELGKGSRFTVNLPCLQEEVIKLEKHEAQPMPPIREREENTEVPRDVPAHLGVILLADDNMPSILTIGEYLESHGYEIVAAHDGSEALKEAEAIHPDLILMDIQMPVMNGLEAIARLRGNARFADTPIIALTALAMHGDRERSLLAGANEYMSKPVSLKLLAKTINELLGKQA